ncbi:hypothetical protein CCP4SC76_5880012 [Gammaproteobacteria bacterium]
MIQSPLDEWIYLLKHSAVRADFHARHIDQAAHKLALLRMSPEERRRHERYVESLVIERDVIETAWQKGRQVGIQESQRQEPLRIARGLLDVIADNRFLAEKTGLSEEDVAELRGN